MKKYCKLDQRLLAIWAADCAERVLPFFEAAYPDDNRPRKAIETLRTWIRTGVFCMSEIRGASLDSHAAAREAKEKDLASCFVARAAGQAVATAHVPQHAFGAVYYALKAVAVSNQIDAEAKIAEERSWMAQCLPENLREEFLCRILVEKRGDHFFVKFKKDNDF